MTFTTTLKSHAKSHKFIIHLDPFLMYFNAMLKFCESRIQFFFLLNACHITYKENYAINRKMILLFHELLFFCTQFSLICLMWSQMITHEAVNFVYICSCYSFNKE